MEVELHVTERRDSKTPPTAWFSSFGCWRRQAGGTTGSRRNPAHPAWSVADENQESGGNLQSSIKRLGHLGSNGMAQ